jgi:uncharacterized protein (DUF1800 family)
MRRFRLKLSGPGSLLTALLLVACGGGGGASGGDPSLPPGQDVPATDGEASRFLTQATFGSTRESIDELRYIGYTQWFGLQAMAKPSLTRPALKEMSAQGIDLTQQHRLDLWWKHAVTGKDQLRQRMAFALSQILVISDNQDNITNDIGEVAEYYDILVRNALGSYRQLLEEAALAPAMGEYLSMLLNQKANPALNIRPDENFAREVLQLFSIGLVQLNQDGTPILDPQSQPIPTYDQAVVEGLAADFTGWTWADLNDFFQYKPSPKPMENWIAYHDQLPKQILGGVILPGGQTGQADLEAALDVIAGHPNVAPFLSKQLIQRLVTSNPSPAYVARVASVWNDDGTGERGDLLAVAKAILMDPEARTGHLSDPIAFGKVKEPLLRMTALWRALDAASQSGKFRFWSSEEILGQAALRAPSVFNFYSPFYSPPGELGSAGLVAPEMQITTHTLITTTTNEFLYRAFWYYQGNPLLGPNDVALNVAKLVPLAATPDLLVEELDVLFTGGSMSSATRASLLAYLNSIPTSDGGWWRTMDALYLVTTSPESAVQR